MQFFPPNPLTTLTSSLTTYDFQLFHFTESPRSSFPRIRSTVTSGPLLRSTNCSLLQYSRIPHQSTCFSAISSPFSCNIRLSNNRTERLNLSTNRSPRWSHSLYHFLLYNPPLPPTFDHPPMLSSNTCATIRAPSQFLPCSIQVYQLQKRVDGRTSYT